MKRPDINAPWILIALLLLAVVVGAFSANPDNVLELGRWSAAVNWSPDFHLLWDGLGVGFLALALIALLASSIFSKLTWGSLGAALAFAVAALAGNAELLLLGWMLVSAPLIVGKRSGVWAATSLVAGFLMIFSLHGVFGTTDLRECLRLSLEPYDFPAAAAEEATALLTLSVATLIAALVFLRPDGDGAIRFRALGILAVGLLSARLAMLSTVTGRFFPFGFRPAAILAALATGAVFGWAFHWARSGETARALESPPSKQLRRWNSAVESGAAWLEDGVWPGLWRIPVQTGRTLGLFFDYWQGGTPQYTLLVMLLGTLILFWAALKTQVIW